AARDARRRVEALASDQARELDALVAREPAQRVMPAVTDSGALALGDTVEVTTFGGRVGRIVGFRGGDATVAVGAVKLTVPASSLSRTREPAGPEREMVPVYGDLPEIHAPREVDLRGMRVDEIDGIVLHALDSAVRADLKAIRIIHGKGTGALRDRVAEMLRGDGRVREFRLGAWNEGGAGVTVAELA
ncbi:MAG: Smr/MutS family protein, partial [Gemmatimonadaceae bacterium]